MESHIEKLGKPVTFAKPCSKPTFGGKLQGPIFENENTNLSQQTLNNRSFPPFFTPTVALVEANKTSEPKRDLSTRTNYLRSWPVRSFAVFRPFLLSVPLL